MEWGGMVQGGLHKSECIRVLEDAAGGSTANRGKKTKRT